VEVGRGRGRPRKAFQEYLTDASGASVGHDDYVRSPGSAFLRYTVEAKNAVELCRLRFEKKNDGTYTKDSADSLQYIVAGMLPAIMGHFETYLRYLFGGMFDLSVYLQEFKIDQFLKDLSHRQQVSIDPLRLSAYRGRGAESVGLVLADSLHGWQWPECVNEYFTAFGIRRQLFSGDDCGQLNVLWQFRHSIVHTGGTLALPDAQRHSELVDLGTRKVVFEDRFVLEVARKMHRIVAMSTTALGKAFRAKLEPSVPVEELESVNGLFLVESPIPAWLPRTS